MRPAAHPDEWRPATPGDGESIDQLSRREPWTEAQYLQLTDRSRRLLDLVIEVVSPDDPSRDTQDKRLDYAD